MAMELLRNCDMIDAAEVQGQFRLPISGGAALTLMQNWLKLYASWCVLSNQQRER
jgi:hypothetical protein